MGEDLFVAVRFLCYDRPYCLGGLSTAVPDLSKHWAQCVGLNCCRWH